MVAVAAMAAIAMMMAVPLDAMRSDTKPSSRAAIGPPVRSRHHFHARAAILSGREAHRDRADRGASHQCQHDAARAFHGTILPAVDGIPAVLVKRARM